MVQPMTYIFDEEPARWRTHCGGAEPARRCHRQHRMNPAAHERLIPQELPGHDESWSTFLGSASVEQLTAHSVAHLRCAPMIGKPRLPHHVKR